MHMGIHFYPVGKMPWVIFILNVLNVGITSGNIVVTPKVPEVNKTATISCFVPAPRQWILPAGAVTCSNVLCDPDAYGSYTFRADSSKTDFIFQSLNITRDERVWTCKQGSTYYSTNLLIYTIPRGLDLTQTPDMNVHLGMTPIAIQCRTTSCTYPEPSIEWLYQNQPSSNTYAMYTRSIPSSTQGPCILPEKIYTGSISISQTTTWSDNSDKTVTFFCRIGYPDPSKNITSLASKPVSFAVRVTEAYLQYNNQNITSTLTVTSGQQITLTCVTGTSRPAPSIGWYIGSQSMGSGTSLIFIPRNTDHNKMIYCQAYNIDPNLKVDSNKPSLFVKVTPEKPLNFHASNVQEKQLVLRWQSGYHGGFTQTFVVEISLDNITWNNVSEVSAGNRDGWFSTVIEDLVPGSEYYLRLYAYNINGRGDYADVQLAIRMLKEPAYTPSLEVCTSVGIGVGGAVGIGVGGIVLGLIGTIITFTIRRKLNGCKSSCFNSKRNTDEELHSYSNTEMNPQTVKPMYEELNKENTEQSVYDKILSL